MHKMFYLVFSLTLITGIALGKNLVTMLSLTCLIFTGILNLFPILWPLNKEEVEELKRKGDVGGGES